jgi:CRISPR/Cas system CMR-associated protein Cmr5 small subunit
MNLEQVRAQGAFAFVQTFGLEHAGERGAFLGLAQSLPAMLQTNGLLAAWAHLLAKGAKKAEHREIARALLEHLRPLGLAPAAGDAAGALTAWWTAPASGGSGRALRRATAEAIAYSVWLKRAAEALLDTGDSGGGAQGAGAAPAGGEAPAPPAAPPRDAAEAR